MSPVLFLPALALMDGYMQRSLEICEHTHTHTHTPAYQSLLLHHQSLLSANTIGKFQLKKL